MCAAGYLREGKRFVTLAVGCTGGKHRSVAMAEELAAPAAGPRHGRRRSCTGTWGGSESATAVAGARPSSPSAAGTGWRRPCRAAPGHRPT